MKAILKKTILFFLCLVVLCGAIVFLGERTVHGNYRIVQL